MPDTPNGEDKKSSGLSGGGIAGVVIGCVAGVIAFLALIAFFVAKRRSRANDHSYDGSIQNILPDGRRQSKGSQLSSMKDVFDGHTHKFSAGSSSATTRLPTFTDNRLKTDTILFPTGRRDSNVSLQDNEDYSRPVLRVSWGS